MGSMIPCGKPGDEPTTTMEQEVQLVRAYLELMHMRMPDRLFARH